MAKKITCKIIDSASLGKLSATVARPCNNHEDTQACDQISGPGRNYKILNASLETLDFAIGQVFDCGA